MNSIGAMNSPVKQSLSTVLAPPAIPNSSPSKVQQPPNLTPLNLNTSQSAQPLSLVNEHKNVPIVIAPPVITSVENIVQKSTACNGVPDAKPIGEKIEEALPKIESQLSHNQVNNQLISDVKIKVSEVENLSQKKDDKHNLPISRINKVCSEVSSINESIKPEESPKSENIVAKLKDYDIKNQGSIEIQTIVQTNQGQTASPEKIEQAKLNMPNTSKGAVRRKREHKVSFYN